MEERELPSSESILARPPSPRPPAFQPAARLHKLLVHRVSAQTVMNELLEFTLRAYGAATPGAGRGRAMSPPDDLCMHENSSPHASRAGKYAAIISTMS